MNEIALSLRDISKCYKRYHRPVDRLKELLLPGRYSAELFWALRNINLDVYQGETLGIVGQNGSGKSTLLQIIAGTLTPTTGQVYTNGRISALLELGSGFNPEFTGRQNVFFNGRLLGLSRQEIEARFDAIAAFAEIGDFIDQPVKTYSSGMMVRLAFAVVANTEPKILIVDEALAVGDARFQARCMKRIRELREQGVTILFVSHDSSSVKMLCERAVLMNYGRIQEVGSPKDIINHYIALLSAEEINPSEPFDESPHTNFENPVETPLEPSVEELEIETLTRSSAHSSAEVLVRPQSDCASEADQSVHRHGNQQALIRNVQITDANHKSSLKIETGTVFTLRVTVDAKVDLSDLVVGISIRNLIGLVIYGTNTLLVNDELLEVRKNQSLDVVFQIPCHFNKGVYTVTVGLHSQAGISYDWIDELIVFEVINGRHCDGVVDLNAQVKLMQPSAKPS